MNLDAITHKLPSNHWARLAIAAAAAITVNLVLFGVGHALGADMLVPDTADPDVFIDLPAGLVAVATGVPIALAGAIAAGVERWLPQLRRLFLPAVGILFLLSFIPTFTSGLSTGTTVVLALMHPTVAAAAALIAPGAESRTT